MPPAEGAYPRYQDEPPRPGVMDRVIPTSNPNALVGYYLGLFAIMPVFGLLLGPAGIILGLKGLKAVKHSPGLPGTGHAITALVGGIIGCLVNYGLGAIILIAYLSRPR